MVSSTRVEFTGSRGQPLAARLDLPAGPARGHALFVCDEDLVAASRISRALAEYGIAVLRFDVTADVEDVVRAADHLRTHLAAPTLLIGHALGGAAVLAARRRIPEVRAVATIAAPADPGPLGGDLAERIATLDAALLILHSPVDEQVGVDNARRVYDTARHPKSFISLDGADHQLTDPADATYAASVLAPWAARYALSKAAATRGGQVVVAESGVGPYGQRVTAGQHVLNADEPAPIGLDSGPNPYELLLSALGACTSMTLRMYADRKGWPLERVTVDLDHTRIHATDCADCETRTGKIDRIERTIHLEGDLDADQRARLLEIADKCPVHRTLRSEIDIRTR